MTEPTDAEREQFEEMMRRETFDDLSRVSDGSYKSYEARVGWIAWQAARRTPAPVGVEPAQWQKRHPTKTEGKWENTNEADAKWWRDSSQVWEIRALYTTPQPTRVQPDPQVEQLQQEIAGLRDAKGDAERVAFITGWDERGMAHCLRGTPETDERMRQLIGIYFLKHQAALAGTAPQPAEPKFVVSTEQKTQSGFAPYPSKAVRVTDPVTGLSVMCDSERSQHANRNIAWEQLEALIAVTAPVSQEYAELPDYAYESDAGQKFYDSSDMCAFADATHALRVGGKP